MIYNWSRHNLEQNELSFTLIILKNTYYYGTIANMYICDANDTRSSLIFVISVEKSFAHDMILLKESRKFIEYDYLRTFTFNFVVMLNWSAFQPLGTL